MLSNLVVCFILVLQGPLLHRPVLARHRLSINKQRPGSSRHRLSDLRIRPVRVLSHLSRGLRLCLIVLFTRPIYRPHR